MKKQRQRISLFSCLLGIREVPLPTCHWCHVMERESFENKEAAEILNKHFISIKVDREERPDIDTIYMSVCQAMAGHGGWPLTVVLTPDKHPFFAGTYFPRKSARGLPGLIDILQKIAHLWENEKSQLLDSGRQILEAVQENLFVHAPGEISQDTLDKAFNYFSESFDPRYGGFGRAPKFPTPHNLSFLLRYWKLTGNSKALEMVEKTLESMYLGGIYDHIGFGFARYSTDRQWLVPHFEKMLYDNALLAISYLEAYQATGKENYAEVAGNIFTYVLRDMTSPEGGFYSAEDADSEGSEGKFYVWTPDEIRAVLGDDRAQEFCQRYDITDAGNFEEKNIPNLIKTGYTTKDPKILQKIFETREKRIHPFKDDKILTAWNGLMIAAMAFGARVLAEPHYVKAAERAANFVFKNLRRNDGRLLARFRDGEAAFPAYADDYAFFIWGLIELFQVTFNSEYLKTAVELNDDLIHYFWDGRAGGLFQYGSDSEQLITRPKESYDGALPSANSVSALNFLRLAGLTGNSTLKEKGELQLKTFGGSVNDAPMGHTHFLMAACFDLTSALEVNIIGRTGAHDTQALIKTVNSSFEPQLLFTVSEEEQEGRKMLNGKAAAFVCRNFTCQPPVTEAEKLAEILQEKF